MRGQPKQNNAGPGFGVVGKVVPKPPRATGSAQQPSNSKPQYDPMSKND